MLRADVPILNSNVNASNREAFLQILKSAKTYRLWLALDRCTLFERGDSLEALSENIEFFEQNGIQTGVWMQAFGFGSPLPVGITKNWTRLKSREGVQKDDDAFCPEDDGFLKAYCDWVRDIAKTGTRLIMLDDDLCMSVRPGIGCFCDKHMQLLNQKIGEAFDIKQIFTGSKNKYRDAYLEVMGNTMRSFCQSVRNAVDSVDNTIRVGLCAGYTSWDLEGTDPIEMSKILAGNTKPFFRFTGAPYWVALQRQRFKGQRLSAVIECARNQISWSKNSDAEFFAEADSYPRPCYHCNASLIENFDIVMQASGVRSLKYIIDYYSSPEYEKQYYKIHTRNIPLCEYIQNAFKDSKPFGVRLYRPAHRLSDISFPDEFIGEKPVMTKSFFSMSASMLSALGIPTVYDGKSDFAAVFGDEAHHFKNDHSKIIVDLPAALVLQKRGFDVGIRNIRKIAAPTIEHFENEKTLLCNIQTNADFYDVDINKEAKVLSTFDTGAVASFVYDKFLVLNFDALYVGESSTLLCSYARQKQIFDFLQNPFPKIEGFADVYSICNKTQNGFVALFQNHSTDPVFDFDITLPKPCKAFKLYGAEGTVQGSKIHITTDFHPSSTIIVQIEY